MRGPDHSLSSTVSMCLIVCDLETSIVRRSRQALDLCTTSKRKSIEMAKHSVLS